MAAATVRDAGNGVAREESQVQQEAGQLDAPAGKGEKRSDRVEGVSPGTRGR